MAATIGEAARGHLLLNLGPRERCVRLADELDELGILLLPPLRPVCEHGPEQGCVLGFLLLGLTYPGMSSKLHPGTAWSKTRVKVGMSARFSNSSLFRAHAASPAVKKWGVNTDLPLSVMLAENAFV